MPPKRRATKRKATAPPVTRGAAKKSTGSDQSSSKTAKATKDAESAQKKADDAEAEAAEDARQAAEAARVAEKERRIRKAAKAKSAADRAKKLADDAVKAAEEAAAAAEASDAADDIDPDSTPVSSGAEESEEDSPIETTIEDIRSPLAKFGKRRLMRSTSPAAAFQYKRALALIREYDREQDVDSWIQQFHFEADQLSPKDRLAVFRLKVQTKCAGWYNGELLKEPGRPLYRWLKVFGDKFRRTASQRTRHPSPKITAGWRRCKRIRGVYYRTLHEAQPEYVRRRAKGAHCCQCPPEVLPCLPRNECPLKDDRDDRRITERSHGPDRWSAEIRSICRSSSNISEGR